MGIDVLSELSMVWRSNGYLPHTDLPDSPDCIASLSLGGNTWGRRRCPIDVQGAQPGFQGLKKTQKQTPSQGQNAAVCSGAGRAVFANVTAENELMFGKEKVKDKRKLIFFPIMHEASKIQMWIVFKSGCGPLPQVTVSPAYGARKCVADGF